MNSVEKYWQRIARARNDEELRAAIASDSHAAPTALGQTFDLLRAFDLSVVSRAVDQLRWLGTQVAERAGNPAAGASLEAKLHQTAAMNALQSGEKKQAASHFYQAAVTSLRGDDTEEAVRTTLASTILLLRIGEHERALRAAEAMLARVERGGFGEPGVRMALYEFARVARSAPATARWATQLARMRRGLEGAGDSATAGGTAFHLGTTLVRMGAYEAGLEIFADVLPMLRRTGLKRVDGGVSPMPEAQDALLWRARAYDLCGRETEAEQAYRAHPALNQDGSDEPEVITRLAELLIENNRLQEALDLLLAHDFTDARFRALTLALVSLVYALLNRPEASAAAAAEVPVALAESPEENHGGSEFHRAAAEGLRSFGKIFEPDALDWRIRLTLAEHAAVARNVTGVERGAVREALEWSRRNGERAMECRCLRVEGEIAMASGESETALSKFEAALDCELTSPDYREWNGADAGGPDAPPAPPELRAEQIRRTRLEAGVGMETLLAVGRAKAAAGIDPLPACDAVIAVAQRRNRRFTLYYALAVKARWLSAAGKSDDATKTWERAMDVLESLRTDFREVESQIGVLEDKEAGYGDLLLAAVESGDAEGAMRLMERAKSRALLEELSAEEYARPLSPEMEEKARHLRQALVRAMREQMQTGGGQAQRLPQLKDQIASVYRTANGPRALQRQAGARAADVARLSEGGKAVLHFFVSEEQVIVAAARDGELVTPVRLACSSTELAQLLETFQFEISTRDNCHSLGELYSALIKPIEATLDGVERIIIVPHGILHTAPLHALRGADGTYLAERCVIQYAPSAGVVLRAREGWGDERAEGAVLVAATRTPYSPLPELGAAAVEIEAISAAIAGARVLKGVDAIRRHVLRVEGNLDVLHMACHGEFDRDDPLLSRLYLADGPLYGYEIQRLGCRPRLVVLSACETGVQQRAAGDETFGLVRAFLSRGASAVVASLWKVADESTAILMSTFYRELVRKPDDAAGALLCAQRELLSMPKYSHPFWWAPYVVICN